MARDRREFSAILGVYSASSPDAGLPMDLFAGRDIVLAFDNDQAVDNAEQKLFPIFQPVAHAVFRQVPSA